MSVANERVPLALALGWGVGTLAPSVLFNTTAFLLMRYLTDYLGVAAATAGVLLTVAKLYDIVINPAMGHLSDRSRSSAGRRRPWLLLGALLAALGFLGLFAAPGTPGVVFVLAMLLLYSTGYTVFNVPYMAMPAEIAGSYHERSRLMSFRVYAIAIGTFVGGALAPLLVEWFGGGVGGHRGMAWVLATIVLASAAACFVATRNAPATEPSRAPAPGWRERVALIVGNRPFALLLLTKLLQLFAIAASQATMAYFVVRVLGYTYRELGYYALVGAAAIFITQPLWLRLSRRVGKSHAYAWAATGYALVTLSWLLAGAGEPALTFYARAAVAGALSGGLLLMGQSLLPDTIEYDYLRSGLRREGLFAGLYSMAEKLAGAIGAAVTATLLGALGYVASRGQPVEQPESAILGIYLCVAVVPALAMLASCLALARYDLDEATLVDARRRAVAA
jgi:GPH family glycoside/pentoside/hexuronide:cation symporter